MLTRHFVVRVWVCWSGPALLVAFAAVASFLVLRKHAALHTDLFDLGYYTQVIWNTAYGRWFASSVGQANFLTGHFSPILALLAPLFWVAPDAGVLLVVNVVCLATGAAAAYIFLRERYPNLAPLVIIGYVLNPTVHQVALGEFHEIVLAVPLLAIAALAAARQRRGIVLVSLGTLLLVREDMGLYVASFGMLLAIRDKGQRLLGVGLVVAGVASFVAITRWAMPLLGGSYRHLAAYSASDAQGNGLQGILQTGLERLTQPDRLWAVARFLLPLAGIPLLAAGEQLLWVPGLFVLAQFPSEFVGTLQGWYIAPLLPLMWFSAAAAIKRLRPRFAWPAGGVLVIASVVALRLFSAFPAGAQWDPNLYSHSTHARLAREIAHIVPDDAALAASSRLGAHLATRKQLYLFPWYNHESPPQWIVLDTTDPNPYPLSRSQFSDELAALWLDPRWQPVWEEDGYVAFRDADPDPTLVGPWLWPPFLRLNGVDLASEEAAGTFVPTGETVSPGSILRVSLYWTALAPTEANCSVSARLTTPDGRLVAQDDNWPGQGVVPTSMWGSGLLRDLHYLTVPETEYWALSLAVVVYETESLRAIGPQTGMMLATLPVAR